jgi:hypothetical protein
VASGCFLPAPERGGRPLAKASSAPFRGLTSLPTDPDGLRRGLFSFAPTELKGTPTFCVVHAAGLRRFISSAKSKKRGQAWCLPPHLRSAFG